MGLIFALVAVVASLVLSLVGTGTPLVFYALAAIAIGIAGSAWFRSPAGWTGSVVLLGWFAIMIAAPFSVTRQQTNALNRLARGGDEQAAALLEFYKALEPYSFWLMTGITLIVIALFVLAARRARQGAFAFLLDESDAIARFTVGVGVTASVIYLPMILIIVYDVLQRKYLDIDPNFTRTLWYEIFTSTRLQEMQWHLHAVLFLMCFAFAYVKDAHVRIELVREQMKPRMRVWIELLGCIFFLVPYCYVVLLYGIENAQRSFGIMERSSAQTGLEFRFIIKSFLPLGFMMLALAGMSVALKCIVYLFGPDALRNASGYYGGEQHSEPPAGAVEAKN
jgi:TRAP-type mannitol/chloroaromatic compound transport system permease small subunit